MILNRKINLSSWFLPGAFFIICSLQICFGADAGKDANSFGFSIGKEQRIDVTDKNIGGGYFNLYVPSNYSPDSNWPVIFFYPGAGCKPSTGYFETTTGGENFIIIAMEYMPLEEKVTVDKYINYLGLELRSIAGVVHYITKTLNLKIDRKRMFLAGVSKGGWLVSSLMCYRPNAWKGAMILCAGRQDFLAVQDKEKIGNKAIYIGAGETDANLSAAKKASGYFTNCGADVTFEVYKGLGHAANYESPTLRAWFLRNASIEPEHK